MLNILAKQLLIILSDIDTYDQKNLVVLFVYNLIEAQ